MSHNALPPLINNDLPPTALAPMQDVTTLAFMSVIASVGSPDYFFTEYFRVHESSKLDPHILDSITENPSGRPVFAQLIGEDLFHMERTCKDLMQYPIAGIDLNMGCPAPKVYKKNVGGGLLRDLNKVDALLGHLRETIPGLFTVKMRLGFEDTENFYRLLELINKHCIDLLSLHGRTVKEMYRSEVHYDLIEQAARVVRCPILANGNITSAEKAQNTLKITGCWGVMMGRSAIRNPWIFRQTREYLSGKSIFRPKLKHVFSYIEKLCSINASQVIDERFQVNYIKKFLNFVGQGVDEAGEFLYKMRRVSTQKELFDVCENYLIRNENAEKFFAFEPYPNLIARPSREGPIIEYESTCSL